MNLKQLQYFVTLCELQHMTKAAEVLYTTQPNLSHSMNELEKELGIPLFEKSGRNITLTKYGKLFLEYAQRSLNELKQGTNAIKELDDPLFGKISFGSIYTMGYSYAPLLMSRFKERKENKDISFSLSQGTSTEVIKLLLTGQVDVALTSFKADEEHRIDFVPVIEQELILITPLKHPLAKFDEISLVQIANFPYINFTPRSRFRPMIDEMFNSLNLRVNTAFEIDEDHSIIKFVEYNFGIAIIANIPNISNSKVKVLKITDLPFRRYIYLATLKDRYLPQAPLRFSNFIKEYIKQPD